MTCANCGASIYEDPYTQRLTHVVSCLVVCNIHRVYSSKNVATKKEN